MKYKDLVTINQGWNSLQEYGINALTGEADTYSFRILCDLSEKGVLLLVSFLGGAVTFNDTSNWNSHVGDDPAVSTVMLPYSIYHDLCRFILFHVEKKTYVYEFESGQMTGTDESLAEDKDIRLGIKNTYVNYGKLRNSQPNEGGRNIHIATGRVT